MPSPSTSPIWSDALRYPLLPGAVAANVVLALGQLLAGVIGSVLGTLLAVVLWIGLYSYALEILAASASGRDDPPEALTEAGEQTRRSHFWLQVLLLAGLTAASALAGPLPRFWLLAGFAAILPGALLALTVGQTLGAALNPANWLLVGLRLGANYWRLALASFGLFHLQQLASDLLAASGTKLLLAPLLQLLVAYGVFALFRILGLTLRANAEVFGYVVDIGARPVLLRDREQQAVQADIDSARQAADPAERATLLGRALRRGADEAVHRQYRQALRDSGQPEALRAHARERVCELLQLGQPRPAIALATEALEDEADFTLEDGDSALRLCELAERQGMARLSAAIAVNYRQAFPRRRDGIPLALRASALLGGRLGQPDAARRLIEDVADLAAGSEYATAVDTARRALAGATTRPRPPHDAR